MPSLDGVGLALETLLLRVELLLAELPLELLLVRVRVAERLQVLGLHHVLLGEGSPILLDGTHAAQRQLRGEVRLLLGVVVVVRHSVSLLQKLKHDFFLSFVGTESDLDSASANTLVFNCILVQSNGNNLSAARDVLHLPLVDVLRKAFQVQIQNCALLVAALLRIVTHCGASTEDVTAQVSHLVRPG